MTSKKENIPPLCSNGMEEHNWDLWYPRPEILREDGVYYARECQQMGCEGVQHAANLIPAHEDEQQHLRERDAARAECARQHQAAKAKAEHINQCREVWEMTGVSRARAIERACLEILKGEPT